MSAARATGDGFRRASTASRESAWLYPGSHRVLPTSTEAVDFDRPGSVSSGLLGRREPDSHRRCRRGLPSAGSPRRAVVFANPACAWSGSWPSSATAAAAAQWAGSVLLRDLSLSARPDGSASAPIPSRLGCRRFGTGRPVRPRPQWGLVAIATGDIKSNPGGGGVRRTSTDTVCCESAPDRPPDCGRSYRQTVTVITVTRRTTGPFERPGPERSICDTSWRPARYTRRRRRGAGRRRRDGSRRGRPGSALRHI